MPKKIEGKVVDISSLHMKKIQHLQQRGGIYIGNRSYYKKKTIGGLFHNLYNFDLYGHNHALHNYKLYVRNNPKLWKALDFLEGKTLLCHCSPPMCHGDMLLELLWEKKHGIPPDVLHDRRNAAESSCQETIPANNVRSYELPASNTQKPLTLSDICSGMCPIVPKSVVEGRAVSSPVGCGLLLNSYTNPNYHLPPSDHLPYGTGQKRLCDDFKTVSKFTFEVGTKTALYWPPSVNDPCVLVAGHSQLRTFATGRVSCPDDWAVLSVPGGLFGHVEAAIHHVASKGYPGRDDLKAIVLMCGTNDLVTVDSHSWKEDFRRLLRSCQCLFPQLPTFVIAPLPRRDDKRHLVPHLRIAMGEVCGEFFPGVFFFDFSRDFPLSDTFLWALNDPVHLSDNHGLPRLQRKVSDMLARHWSSVEDQKNRLEPTPLLPEYIWNKIRRHAIFSAIPCKQVVPTRCEPRLSIPRKVLARKEPVGISVTPVRKKLEPDLGCLVDLGHDTAVYIPVKWPRQRKIDRDNKKGSTVVGRNRSSFKRKKVTMTPKKEAPFVRFPCIVEGCTHGFFGDDGEFLDHMILKHSIVDKVSMGTTFPIQDSLQSEKASLDLLASSSPECAAIAAATESPSDCLNDNFAVAVDGRSADHDLSLSDNEDPRVGNIDTSCPTTAGDVELNPGPTENKRGQSEDSSQTKKRKISIKVETTIDSKDTSKKEKGSSNVSLSEKRKRYIVLSEIPKWSPLSKKGENKGIFEVSDTLNSKVSLWKGDITTLKIDAIVNAAKKDLCGGDGVDGCIHKAAGPKLLQECIQLNGCNTGECKSTGGYELPANYVIHTVGPDDKDSLKLQKCYENCLQVVLDKDLKSLAFCCISTGVYGFPQKDAADIALKVTRKWLQEHSGKVDRIIFCTFLPEDFHIYKELMTTMYFPYEQHITSQSDIDFTVTHLDVEPPIKKVRQMESDPQINLQSESLFGGAKKRGRKEKVKKAFPVAVQNKGNQKKLNFTTLYDIQKKSSEGVTIHVKDIKSDIPNEDISTGFFYCNARAVTITYSINDSIETQSIRLDNLNKRGFPVQKLPDICIIDKKMLDEIAAKSVQSIEITMVTTDIDEQLENRSLGPWKYRDTMNVKVSYLLNKKTTHYIRLDNLLDRGFPLHEKGFKYFSFLHLKQLVKASRFKGKLSDAIEDEIFFMDMLRKIDNHYICHSSCIKNEEIGDFFGPQCYNDRLNVDKLHYYGQGKIKYYRWDDLLARVRKDYSQEKAAEFENDVADEKIVTEERFEAYLTDIHNNIRGKYNIYHHLFHPYSGPQCNEDRLNMNRIHYTVKYKSKHPKNNVLHTHPLKSMENRIELKETFDNCNVSFRFCQQCKKVRILGERAAAKYPLGFYQFNNQNQTLIFTCENLFNVNCTSDGDLKQIRIEDVQRGKHYIVYSQNNESLFGFCIQIQNIENEYAEVTFLKPFGCKKYIVYNWPENQNWLYSSSKSNFMVNFGNRGKTGRWKKGVDLDFSLCEITIAQPNEAKCCQVFHDTHFENSNIDNDDPSTELYFESLIRVCNIHKLLQNLKILLCVKCGSSVPGIEDFENLDFIEKGKSFNKKMGIEEIYNSSEVVNSTNLHLDPSFQRSNLYSSSKTHVSSVCQKCSKYYDIQHDGYVIPHIEVEDSQSQSDCASSPLLSDKENSQEDKQINKKTIPIINPWSAENLFSLNLFNEEHYACFMRSLTKAELMVISPLHINIQIIRCRATQIPFSKHGSIAYPLKSPMETNELPWTDFRNLPFIVVYNEDCDANKSYEAKINLHNIVHARKLMTENVQHPLFDGGRSRYRLISDGFCTFTNEQMDKLKKQLQNADNSYVVPSGIRQHQIDEYRLKLKQHVPKAQVENWLYSEYPLADAVFKGFFSGRFSNFVSETIEFLFEEFWLSLKNFVLKKIMKECNENKIDIVEYSRQSNLGDRMVTYELLIEYLISNKLLNDVHGVSYTVYEEFCILAISFSNDEGSNFFAYGAVNDITGDAPDEIIEKNLQHTVLDRRRIEVDRAKKAPEWSPGYLQKAFVDVFLTGDADLYQQRPIPLTRIKGPYREDYLKQLSMLEAVQKNTQLVLTINNMLRRLDAFQGAHCFLKDVDVTSVNIPSKEDLLNNVENVTKLSHFIMQYAPMTRDSKQSWKFELQNEIGIKRDLEYTSSESRPDVKYPTLASVFRTMAFPYTSVYYFHRLFSYEGDEIKDINKRRSKVLVNSTAIEWVGSLLAELDLKYLSFYRYQTSYYVGRDEKGANGNPHWHSLLYSKHLGKLTEELKQMMEEVFKENVAQIKQNATSGIWTEKEKATVTDAVHKEWLDAREKVISFFKGQYTNWNPCYTSSSEPTGNYTNPDISTIRLSDLINTSLETGDFSVINKLFCDIVNSYCRHIVHRGVNGLPAKNDYCYNVKPVKDKLASVGSKVVTKQKVTCTRRKPQPIRACPAIYRDPHDQKLYQLSFESNDEWFNGADPFMILNNLGNCDCKALVPAVFTRLPKYEFADDHNVTMSMHMDIGDGAVEYVIKYMVKSPIPIRTDVEIFSKVSLGMEHGLTKSGVYQCYAQAAVQGCVSLFTAQHVNLNIPQLMRNTNCFGINVIGRKTLKKVENPQNINIEDSYLNKNYIDKFEARIDISPKSTVSQEEVSKSMSLHTFFDKYKLSFDKDKKLIVRKRNRVWKEIYQAISLKPHTTLMQANPSRPYYGDFCKKMCLWSKNYKSIRESVKKFTKDKKNEENEYWTKEFDTTFPGGDGLDPIFKAFFLHYNRKSKDSDSDDDIEDCDNTNVEVQIDKNDKEIETNAKKSKPDRFYQTNQDKLINPTIIDNELPTDDLLEERNSLCNEYIANANVEDFTHWLQDENANAERLFNKIETFYTEIKKIKGLPKDIYANGNLSKKQELVHRIIMNWVNDRVGEKKMPPLRLFVIGVPGAGKTFAFKVTASRIIDTLGENWQDKVCFATPTGCVSYHMGFGAKTLHQTFYINVGHEQESYADKVDKILELKRRLPETIFLVVFDEISMLSRPIFSTILLRFEEAQRDTEDIGFIFLGDPAQIMPIGGIPLWSTQLKNENKKCSLHSVNGMHGFRRIMGMARVDTVDGYDYLQKNRKQEKLTPAERWAFRQASQKFGQNVYIGNYNAVYLDEIKRSDGSPEAEQFGNLLKRVRYGKFEDSDLAELKKISATIKDVKSDPEWSSKTVLTDYHYYCEEHPERSNADSINAKSLVEYSRTTKKGIMLFEAIHTPALKSSSMAALNSKEFQGITSKLYLAEGAPVILTTNINPSIGLFNGSLGKFIGPLYRPKFYDVKSLEVLKRASIDRGNRTTVQVELITNGKRVQLPKGSYLIEMNNSTFNQKLLDNLQEPFTAKFEIPCKPPFLPEYLVIDFPDYSKLGGKPFFRDPNMKDYVCIKPFTFSKSKTRHEEHRTNKTRTGFPIELAFVMTAFKGIGDNHLRSQVMVKGFCNKSGLFLVGISRVRNPKHLYIPPNHWPSAAELQVQRLNPTVLESENFERIIRVIGARDMRKYGFDLLENVPPSVSCDIFNHVCDMIHNEWLKQGSDLKIVKANSIYEKLSKDSKMERNVFNDIYNFMENTDEYLLLQDVPYLRTKQRKMLIDVRKGARASKVNLKKKTEKIQTKKPYPNPKIKISSKVHQFQKKGKTTRTEHKKDFDTQNKDNNRNNVSLSNNKIVPFIPVTGIVNFGNTCYANSALQMLRALPWIWEENLQESSDDFVNTFNIIMQNDRNLITQTTYRTFLTNLEEKGEFIPYEQQDVHEALNCIFNTLSQSLNNCFQFTITSTVKCKRCLTPTDRSENCNFLRLSLCDYTDNMQPLPIQIAPIAPIKVQNCIQNFFVSELLSGQNAYQCDICADKTEAGKEIVMDNPRILFIQLLRYSTNEAGVPRKDNRNVIVQEEININNHPYKLKAAICHLGENLNGGHYIAFVNLNGIWYKCNDNTVTISAVFEIEKSEVYILSYEKSTSIP